MHIQILSNITANTGDSVVSGTNGLLTSGFGSSTRGKRHNSYYANPIPNARRILWCLIYLSVEIRKNQLHISTVETQLSTDSFHNPQILRTISSGHDVIHTPAPFPVWGFIMTMVIAISYAREWKTVPNDYAPELLTQIVQSPTKLNDKNIINEKWLI